MSDSLKKMSDSLIRFFLVSNLSNSLTLLIFGEWPERFAHIKKEGMSQSARFFHLQKNVEKPYKKYYLSQKNLSESLVFCEQKSKSAIH